MPKEDKVSEVTSAVASNSPEVTKKRLDPNKKKLYLRLAGLILAVALIVLFILWAKSAVETYKNAKKYKVSHELVQEQLRYCVTPKVENGQDPTTLVHYCDEFKKRFQTVQLEEKK